MRSPSGVTSALLLFRGLGLAAVFTFWFLPSSASSCVGPTAGRRGGLGRHLRPLQCRLCRGLALLFVRPFNVVKRHVTGDPPTPGREETHSGALPSRVSGTPFRSRGPGGSVGAGAAGSLPPLLGPWMLRCLFRASVWARFQPKSPLPSGCSGSDRVT